MTEDDGRTMMICAPAGAMHLHGSVDLPSNCCGEQVMISPAGQKFLRENDQVDLYCTACVEALAASDPSSSREIRPVEGAVDEIARVLNFSPAQVRDLLVRYTQMLQSRPAAPTKDEST